MADETNPQHLGCTSGEIVPRAIVLQVGRSSLGRPSLGGERSLAAANAVRRVPADRAVRRPRRWPQVFPAQESLQVLRRENRRHQLQGRAACWPVCGRKRQDRAAPPDRRVYAAPAASVRGHQAGAQHRPAAVRRPRVVKTGAPRMTTDYVLLIFVIRENPCANPRPKNS